MPNATIDKITVNGTTYDITDTRSGYMSSLVELTYGTSTWNDFLTAYQAKKIVYCAVSGRMAFMAYVNNASTPTEVEFQYYRSRSSHTDNYQGDQAIVYKLTSTGTWTTTTRNAYTKVDTEKGLADSYTTGTVDSVSSSGIIKIKANLRNETKLTNSSVSETEVANRVYPVALDKDGYLSVNVPWTDSGGSAVSDVQMSNGLLLQSVVSNGIATIVTNTLYNASTNKVATMQDVPTITYGTSDPSGGNNGDIYIKYTAPAQEL